MTDGTARRSIGRRIAIGVLALLAAAGLGLWLWKPWMPAVQLAEPGPTGQRVARDGLLGNFYPAPARIPGPGVLLLGGSEGGLGRGGTALAKGLQAAGFSVLHLSYFRGPGQPRALRHAPLETFDRALAWLSRQPGVDGTRLAVVGSSKGAEAALLIATRHPELRATVAAMPSSVVWPGVDWEYRFGSGEGSSWSAGARPVPFLPYGDFDFAKGIRSRYENGLARLARHPEAIIPIEKARGALLLVCGEADALWPACPMARQITARAASNGRPNVRLLAYPQAGHAVFGMPLPAGSPARARLGRTGGTAEGNGAAREDAWPKVVAFIREQTT